MRDGKTNRVQAELFRTTGVLSGYLCRVKVQVKKPISHLGTLVLPSPV